MFGTEVIVTALVEQPGHEAFVEGFGVGAIVFDTCAPALLQHTLVQQIRVLRSTRALHPVVSQPSESRKALFSQLEVYGETIPPA